MARKSDRRAISTIWAMWCDRVTFRSRSAILQSLCVTEARLGPTVAANLRAWAQQHSAMVSHVQLARAAREAILRSNGCSAGIGVGHSRVVARCATRRAKPSGDGVHSRHSSGYSRRLGCRQCSCRTPSERAWAPGPLPWFEITVDQAEVNWGVRLADRRQASQTRTSIPVLGDSLRCSEDHYRSHLLPSSRFRQWSQESRSSVGVAATPSLCAVRLSVAV